MKGIYFLSFVFILILTITLLITSRNDKCLSDKFIYFGTPSFVREGFDIQDERWKRYNESIISASPCYPYDKATHIPTDFAVKNYLKYSNFNKQVSNKIATTPPIGNDFTMYYKCRKSPISYKTNTYDDCSSLPANSCFY